MALKQFLLSRHIGSQAFLQLPQLRQKVSGLWHLLVESEVPRVAAGLGLDDADDVSVYRARHALRSEESAWGRTR